ncbi:MAG: pantoate--beta-alanine ligase [Bacteroidetes bacterium]|nr:pantoate--beta-alanine ligase [Bacteroidota bacterium]
MYIFKKTSELQQYVKTLTSKPGFVPTMGALHQGHISLIHQSKQENDLTVCSVFINPTQFNDPKDFDKYPITLAADIEKLLNAGTDILFLPSVEEMYPDGIQAQTNYPLGFIDTVLEGKFRPGHFQGVCTIVHKLLDAVTPANLYMGEKDFQQCMVIKKLLSILDSKIALHTCATLRESNGLAMSSRNERLLAEDRLRAGAIFENLMMIKSIMKVQSFQSLQEKALHALIDKQIAPEYLLLCEADTLVELPDFDFEKKMALLIAAKIGNVRLIDNLRLN